jgi:hypothetical protein
MGDEKGMSILDEAQVLVNGPRAEAYGDSLIYASYLWSAYTELEIEPSDVALMMVLLKVARQKNQAARDNLVDAAGYVELAWRFVEQEREAIEEFERSQAEAGQAEAESDDD